MLEAKSSITDNYDYYMDVTEYMTNLFGADIVKQALVKVVDCMNEREDGTDTILETAYDNVRRVLNEIRRGDGLSLNCHGVMIEFVTGKAITIWSSEDGALRSVAVPDMIE